VTDGEGQGIVHRGAIRDVRGGSAAIMLAVSTIEPTQHELPFVLGVTEPDRRAADQRYERVRARFAEGTEMSVGQDISDRAFVDHLLFSLLADFDGDVDEIAGGGWFRVRVTAHSSSDAPVRLEVQCDYAVDGLVAIWDWLDTRAGHPKPAD
jgi:hypothetical protein